MIQYALIAVLMCLGGNLPMSTKSDLINKVRSGAADLNTLAFVAELKDVAPKKGRYPAEENRKVRLKVFMADGAKFRVEGFRDGEPLGTIVSDGKLITEWDARKNLWTRYPMPEFNEEYFLRPLIMKDRSVKRYADSWVDERGPFGPWMDRVISSPVTTILPPQHVGERLCSVVRYDAREFSIFSSTHETGTFYFDQTTDLPRKYSKQASATTILLRKYRSSNETDYLDMRPNAKLPDDVFVFTPPDGAEFIDPSDPRFLTAVPDGEPAPDLELALIDGTTVTLRDVIKDKVALVSFWATWCPPCIQEMPALARLHEEFTERDFVVVGVSRDSDITMVKAFVGNRPMPYLQGHDADGAGGDKYLFEAIPHTVLINRQGNVVKTWQGWDGDEEEAEIRESVKKLIEVK